MIVRNSVDSRSPGGVRPTAHSLGTAAINHCMNVRKDHCSLDTIGGIVARQPRNCGLIPGTIDYGATQHPVQ